MHSRPKPLHKHRGWGRRGEARVPGACPSWVRCGNASPSPQGVATRADPSDCSFDAGALGLCVLMLVPCLWGDSCIWKMGLFPSETVYSVTLRRLDKGKRL